MLTEQALITNPITGLGPVFQNIRSSIFRELIAEDHFSDYYHRLSCLGILPNTNKNGLLDLGNRSFSGEIIIDRQTQKLLINGNFHSGNKSGSLYLSLDPDTHLEAYWLNSTLRNRHVLEEVYTPENGIIQAFQLPSPRNNYIEIPNTQHRVEYSKTGSVPVNYRGY